MQPVVFPNFDKVIEGDEVLTKLFVDTSKSPGDKWEPPLLEEDRVVVCQAVHQALGMEEWKHMPEN